eukprot:365094-Chlamydomonas_euryale.AAC.3
MDGWMDGWMCGWGRSWGSLRVWHPRPHYCEESAHEEMHKVDRSQGVCKVVVGTQVVFGMLRSIEASEA